MLRHNFCRPDGRLVKLFLFSTLLYNSPLTFIYFVTFEKKREVRSPLPTQLKFLVFGKYYIYIQLMTVERIHSKAPVMLIFIAISTCLPSCINLSNIEG